MTTRMSSPLSPTPSSSALADLTARARSADGSPPFSDGALVELAQGTASLVWLDEAGMARLASRGIRTAHLYVEGDNALALRLYRGFGFTDRSVDIQYRWARG